MAPLTSEQLRREQQNRDPSSITSLNLNLRALTDVSCLIDFVALERLDLSCNSIRTLEGLGCCGNLKWLSVAQNKIESLKGIEGLSKLTVLNAGQNMIQSIAEVISLTNLRALILNDNKISALCKLEPLKCLNTLVLSRNPINDLGKSLANMKSLTKVSFSDCKIQEIGSSLVSCMELKEARFAHNEIVTIPGHFSKNAKLQLLDLGKNAISHWTDIKVLSELHNLRNLNLQGNPIAEKSKIAKKVKKMVPKLQIFNAKPIEKCTTARKTSDEGVLASDKDHNSFNGVSLLAKGVKRKKDEVDSQGEHSLPMDGTQKKVQHGELLAPGQALENENVRTEAKQGKEWKEQKPKKTKKMKSRESESIGAATRHDAQQADIKTNEGDEGETVELGGTRDFEFDDGKASFMDVVFSGMDDQVGEPKSNRQLDDKFLGGLVMNPTKEKKKKKRKMHGVVTGRSALAHLPPLKDVGIGGPSAWDD